MTCAHSRRAAVDSCPAFDTPRPAAPVSAAVAIIILLDLLSVTSGPDLVSDVEDKPRACVARTARLGSR